MYFRVISHLCIDSLPLSILHVYDFMFNYLNILFFFICIQYGYLKPFLSFSIFIFTYASLFHEVSNHFIYSVMCWFCPQFVYLFHGILVMLSLMTSLRYYIIVVIFMKLLKTQNTCGKFSFVMISPRLESLFVPFDFRPCLLLLLPKYAS